MVENVEGGGMRWSNLCCAGIGESSSCLCFANLT